MKATLTVNRNDLKAKLENRIAEIEKAWEESERIADFKTLREKLTNGESLEDFTARTLDWHRKVAEGLENGTITIGAKGQLCRGPRKPVRSKFMTTWGQWNIEAVDKELKYAEEAREAALKPLRTSIEILDMATSDDVQIDTTDYHALLNADYRHCRYF